MDPDDHIIINTDNEITCKYCFDFEYENKALFILPCKCKNPICVACFSKHIELNDRVTCELCLAPYEISYINKYKKERKTKCDYHWGMLISFVSCLIIFFIYIFVYNKQM